MAGAVWHSRWGQWGLALLAIALVLGVFWPGLSGDFIFDDIGTIVDNARVHASSLDWAQLSRAATSFDPGGTFGARPLSMVSFALNHIAGGLDPWGYKLTGLLIHLLNCVLVFALVRCILSVPELKAAAWSAWAPWAMTLVWAVHPMQVSSVLYVVQRMETLSATFMLVAMLCYLRARLGQLAGKSGLVWLAGCMVSTAVGVLAKESAVLVLAYVAVVEVTLFRFHAQSVIIARALKFGWFLGVGGAVLLLFAVVVPHYWVDNYFGRDFGSAERLLTQLRVLVLYLGQLVYPLPSALTFYYDDLQVSRGWLQPVTTLVSGLFMLGLFALAVLLILKRRAPLIALGILWFFVSHLLTSNVVGLELMFEHRNYLALLGPVLVIADLISRVRLRDGPGLKYVAVGAVLLALAGLCVMRSAVWGNPLLMATDMASENPDSPRAISNLAAIYLEMADRNARSPFSDLAIAQFERASLLPGASVIADQGLILSAVQMGRPVPDVWWERLITKLRTQPITPETSGALMSMMSNRYKGFELDDERLVEAFMTMFSRVTFPPHTYAQFGDYALTKVDDQKLADWAFATAIEESVATPDYARRIVRVLNEKGNARQAQVALDKAHAIGLLQDVKVTADAR